MPGDPLVAQRAAATPRSATPRPAAAASTGPAVAPPSGAASRADALVAERLARLVERQGARPSPGSARPGGQPVKNGKPSRRRHVARGSRIAALTMSLVTTGGLTAAFASSNGTGTTDPSTVSVETAGASASAAATTAVAPTTPSTPATVAAATESPAAAVATVPATTAAPETTTAVTASGLADGTYTGAGSSNRWGTVQVQIVVQSGSITEAVALQSPDGDRKSIQINARALPTLASEAVSAQSANIDGVSGATYTSRSYAESLQSAIDEAKAA